MIQVQVFRESLEVHELALALGPMVVTAGGLWVYFKRKGWL
jgi:hypothetical protein